MKRSCPEYAAMILHGQITLDDVPESRQQSTRFFLDRCGPDGKPTDPIQVTVGFMKRIERMGQRIRELERELEDRDLQEVADRALNDYHHELSGVEGSEAGS